MYKGMLHLHSVLRWAILILLLLALYKNFVDKNKPFTPGHKKLGLYLMICADIMLLVGIYQWVAGSWGLKSIQQLGKQILSKEEYRFNRFFAIEHATGML